MLNLRLALRGFLRSPGLLVPALVCLGLGVGANAAMLGVLDELLLRPPEGVAAPESIRRFIFSAPGFTTPSGHQIRATRETEASFPMFADLETSDAFSEVAAYFGSETSVGLGEAARKVRAVAATSSLFSLLGVRPVRGRLFSRDEGEPGRPAQVMLVSWEFWQRELGGARDVPGRLLPVGRDLYTVIGVLPRRFTGCDISPVDVWLPISAAGPLWFGNDWWRDRDRYFFQVVGRLRPGVSPWLAEEKATALHRQAYLDLRYEDARGRSVSLARVQQGYEPEAGQTVSLAVALAAASAAVLLVACFNVAGLLLVRGLERRGEFAVRLALGAGRLRLAEPILADSLLLAVLGCGVAVLVSRACGVLVGAFLAPGQPAASETLDARRIVLLGFLSLAAGLACGLAPAVALSRQGIGGRLRVGGGLPRGLSFRALLLAGQVALCCLLVLGAGSFVVSLNQALRAPLGVDPGRVLVVAPDLGSLGPAQSSRDAAITQALERLSRLPGVERVSAGAGIPFLSSFGTAIKVPGSSAATVAPGGTYFNAVTEGFFSTLGTRLLAGRSFSGADSAGSQRVAVVGATLARLLWPGGDAIGRCFDLGGQPPCITVIGIAEDSRRYQLKEPPTFQFYVPLSQAPSWVTERAIFVRTAAAPESAVGAVRGELLAQNPRQPFIEIRPLADLVAPRLQSWRMGATLFSLFGLLALVLALTGTFAVVARAVRSRSREIGLRIALGARVHHVTWLAVRAGFLPAALGTALGLGVSLPLDRFLQPLLFEVSGQRLELVIRAAVVVLVLGASLVACYFPGRRVRLLDPVEVIRAE